MVAEEPGLGQGLSWPFPQRDSPLCIQMPQARWGAGEIQGLISAWKEGQGMRSSFHNLSVKGAWRAVETTQTEGGGGQWP